jgi:hypothetical protein
MRTDHVCKMHNKGEEPACRSRTRRSATVVQGALAEALKAYRDGLAIRKRLAAKPLRFDAAGP